MYGEDPLRLYLLFVLDNQELTGGVSMLTARERLRGLIDERCLDTGRDFVLSTGERSRFYFDCKKITLEGDALVLVADLMLEEIDKLPEYPEAIGGLTIGADFIVAAVILRAYQLGRPTIHGSIARKERKTHGTMNWVENVLAPGTKIAVVDDVLTSGKSTLQACERFEEENYSIVGVIGLVDREREAPEREILRKKYKHVNALFSWREFPRLEQYLSGENNKAAASR